VDHLQEMLRVQWSRDRWRHNRQWGKRNKKIVTILQQLA